MPRVIACLVVFLVLAWYLSLMVFVCGIVQMVLTNISSTTPTVTAHTPEPLLEQPSLAPQPESVVPTPPQKTPPAHTPANPIAPAVSTTGSSSPLASMTTVTEVRTWIQQQAARMPQVGNFSRQDPWIEQLAQVPPAFWGEMLDQVEIFSTSGQQRAQSMVKLALIRAVRPEHHDLVLSRFEKHPFLIDAIVARGWVADVAAFLRQKLNDRSFTRTRFGDTVKFVGALASLHDPRDHPLLTEVLIDCELGYWQAAMARDLAKVPGFNLQHAVRGAWRKRPANDYQDHQDSFAVAAAQAGIAEALPIVFLHALGGAGTAHSTEQLQKEARDFFGEQFGVRVDPADPTAAQAWWSLAQDHLHWDVSTRRWSGPRPTSAPPRTAEP